MGLFSSKEIITVLGWQSLTVFFGDKNIQITFSSQEVALTKILDQGRLSEKIRLFLEVNKLVNSEIILLLSPEMTFQKVLEKNADFQKLKEAFLDEVPYERAELSVLEYTSEGKTLVMVTVTSFYQTIIAVLKQNQASVRLAIPLVAITDSDSKETFNLEAVKTFLSQNSAELGDISFPINGS